MVRTVYSAWGVRSGSSAHGRRQLGGPECGRDKVVVTGCVLASLIGKLHVFIEQLIEDLDN